VRRSVDEPGEMAEKPRILVVDDEPRAVELLVRTLRRLGRVATAMSADEALPMVTQERFDLVISDQRMPGMSGVELLSRIAGHDEQVGRILLTGYTDLETSVEAINRGRVHAYLHKPCSPPELMGTVFSVLQRVRFTRESAGQLETLRREKAELETSLTSAGGRQRVADLGRVSALFVQDLAGPVSGIRSAGGALAEIAAQCGDERVADVARRVAEQASAISDRCADWLEIAEATREDEPRRPEPLDDAVREALAPLAADAAHRGIELRIELRSQARVALRPTTLRCAVGALTRNALEALPDGGFLELSTSVEGDHVTIRVTDDGPGVAPEIAERLFEPFTTFGRPGARGLGLALARAAVENVGGTIGLAKAEGGGARFEIRIPTASSDPQ
jgi:signal transduction histidine kinase